MGSIVQTRTESRSNREIKGLALQDGPGACWKLISASRWAVMTTATRRSVSFCYSLALICRKVNSFSLLLSHRNSSIAPIQFTVLLIRLNLTGPPPRLRPSIATGLLTPVHPNRKMRFVTFLSIKRSLESTVVDIDILVPLPLS